MPNQVFEKLIQDLALSGKLVSRQLPFRSLPETSGLKTADYISVDAISNLKPELRESGFMVLRLGSPLGVKPRHTEFALVRAINGWKDFFFLDEEIFENVEPQSFWNERVGDALPMYRLLPKLTETSMVNLGLGTGLIQKAIGLDEAEASVIPATGSCTANFHFRPHRELPDILHHSSGQVEIDSLFLGKRGGVTCLFVLEAKNSHKLESLAKHKLFYPIMALASQAQYPIIPLYLRTIKKEDHIDFNVAECQPVTAPADSIIALSEIEVTSTSRLRLAIDTHQ